MSRLSEGGRFTAIAAIASLAVFVFDGQQSGRVAK